MRYVDLVLDEVANHPKISQGVAATTMGVSASAEYVQSVTGVNISTDSWTGAGVIIGVIASIVVIFANLRRSYLEELQTRADLKIKQLEAQKLQNEIYEQEEGKKKRR